MLRSANVSVNTVPSSTAPVNTEGNTTKFVAELDEAKSCIAELESVQTVSVRRHEGLLNDVKQRQAEEIGIWRKIFAQYAERLLNDIKVSKADIF